jgi:hypothetical protein
VKYLTGEKVMIWDRVHAWHGCRGIVVFSIDADQFSDRFPKARWGYLERGGMIDTEDAGLVRIVEPDEDLLLVARGGPPTPAEWAEFRLEQSRRGPSEWRSGTGPSVQIGFVNPHGQISLGQRGAAGTDHMQYAYRTECGYCGHVYGANGSDMHARHCPNCQDGAPGIVPF